ncbi:hypothetical protein ACQY1H_04990 [Agrobacterium vitis]|uniref:hypothetical protein n=1 Tax=Agrobacterium vitis TaxID=373 RepID=UPI003D2C83CF
MKASVSLLHKPLLLFFRRALLIQMCAGLRSAAISGVERMGFAKAFGLAWFVFNGAMEKKSALMKVSFDMKVMLSVGFQRVVAVGGGVFVC